MNLENSTKILHKNIYDLACIINQLRGYEVLTLHTLLCNVGSMMSLYVMHLPNYTVIKSVTFKFPNLGHKNHTKNLLIPSLNIVSVRLNTLFILLIWRIKCLRKCIFPMSPSLLSSVCWIDETALNLIPLITLVNQGSKADGITQASLVLLKTRRQCLKDLLVHCSAENTRMHFPH
jgi:hypothetical protein